MPLSLKIAIRYVFTFRAFHFITIISFISQVGIIVGVAALICVVSIFNGFREFSEKQLTSFDPHLRIIPTEGVKIENTDSLCNFIKTINDVSGISSTIDGNVIMMIPGQAQAAYLRSFDQKEFERVSNLRNTIVSGKCNISASGTVPKVLLGALLAERLSLMPGDTIQIISPQILDRAIKSYTMTGGVKAVISGLFLSNAPEYDGSSIFGDISLGAKLFTFGKNQSTCIDIKLNSIDNTDNVKSILEQELGTAYTIQTWYDFHKELYNVMKLERLATFIILSLIIVIAVFNILASLVMTVVEKRADIAIFKALGAKDKMIRNIYLFEGSFIGASGTAIGTILGLLLCFGQIKYEWFRLDTSKYLIQSLPVSVYSSDIIIIVAFALVLTIAAALYPAYKAAGNNITNSLR